MLSATTDEAPASKRHCKKIERSPSPTPNICRSAASPMVCKESDDDSVFTSESRSSHSVEVEDLPFSAEVLEKVQYYAPETLPNFGCMPPEIVERIIETLPARSITISCNSALYKKGHQGLYAKRHAIPDLLRINRHLRESAKTVYCPIFDDFLENGPIYVNFAADKIVIANHEAFRNFFLPLSYSPDVQFSPYDRRVSIDRRHVDNELQNLAFRTFLDTESMGVLVRFRQLRSVNFIERPDATRARTRYDKTKTKDEKFMERTVALWEQRAKARKQSDFKLPEMQRVPLHNFDAMFEITERPNFPSQEELFTRHPWANMPQQKWKTKLP